MRLSRMYAAAVGCWIKQCDTLFTTPAWGLSKHRLPGSHECEIDYLKG